MGVVTFRIRAAADGGFLLADPLPEGEHLATVAPPPPIKPFIGLGTHRSSGPSACCTPERLTA